MSILNFSRKKHLEVSLDIWRRLYEAAHVYNQLIPWKTLSEDDLFALHDPVSGNVDYCSVLGRTGAFLGLVLYRGREGLEMHFQLKSRKIDPDDPGILDLYHAIVVEFCDRSRLTKEELKIIKALKIPDQKQYPKFQSFLPGFAPWSLSEQEARIATLALQCATMCVKRYQQYPTSKNTATNSKYFLLYNPKPTKNGTIQWESAWHDPGSLPAKKFDYSIDEQRIQALKRKSIFSDSPWEVSTLLMPRDVIKDPKNSRPYFARLAVIVNEESERLLQMEMIPPTICPYMVLRESILSSIEKSQSLPEKILVDKKETYSACRSIAQALGIKIELRGLLSGTSQLHGFIEKKISKFCRQ